MTPVERKTFGVGIFDTDAGTATKHRRVLRDICKRRVLTCDLVTNKKNL